MGLWPRGSGLAPLNRFKPSSKIFYWPFQGGTSFVDLLCFCSVLCLLCFVRVCLFVLCGHLLGKGWPLGSRLWCLLWVCLFPIGTLGQVWYLIVSIPDLCTLTYFKSHFHCVVGSFSKSLKLSALLITGSTQENVWTHYWKIVDWDIKQWKHQLKFTRKKLVNARIIVTNPLYFDGFSHIYWYNKYGTAQCVL